MIWRKSVSIVALLVLCSPFISLSQDSLNVSLVADLYGSWGVIKDITLFDNYACAADYSMGIHFMDVADPENPVELDRLTTPGFCTCLVEDEDRLYAGSGETIRLYTLTDPENPLLIGEHDANSDIEGLHIADDILHAVTDDGTYHTIDVSDPVNPLHLGTALIIVSNVV